MFFTQHYNTPRFNMKKEHFLSRKIVLPLAFKIAELDANTTCTFLTHQPKLPESVKRLKKKSKS